MNQLLLVQHLSLLDKYYFTKILLDLSLETGSWALVCTLYSVITAS